MRLFVVILAVVALAGTAMAADVPSTTLNEMGIHGMQRVSDAEGMAIRGKAFTQANLFNGQYFIFNSVLQSNYAKVREASNNYLQGTAPNTVASWQVNNFDGAGTPQAYLAGGLQGTFSQANSILDEQNQVSRLSNIGQENDIQAVGGPGFQLGGPAGPTLDVAQSNALETLAPGNLQTTAGVRQNNLVDVSISVGAQVSAMQVNSIMAGYGRLGANQQNILIVTP